MSKIYDGSRAFTAAAGNTALAADQNTLQDELIDALWGFSDVKAGIVATDPPERFVVRAPAAGQKVRGAQSYSQQGPAGAYTVQQICTDGKYLYIAQDNTVAGESQIYNADPDDGQVPASGNWSWTPGISLAVYDMCCDGDYVWVAADASAGNKGLWRLDASDGTATKYTDHAVTDGALVAADGAYVAFVDDTSTSTLFVYQQDGTYGGSYAATDTIKAICMSRGTIYCITHDGTTGLTIHAVDPSTQTADWTKAYTTTSQAHLYQVVCDGNRIYAGHTRTTIGGTQRCASIYTVYDGNEVATIDTGANFTSSVAVDHRYLYCCDGTFTRVHSLADLQAGVATWSVLAADKFACCDGVSLFSATGNNVQRHWTGETSIEYQRVAGDDGNRVPWSGHLAVPTGRQL